MKNKSTRDGIRPELESPAKDGAGDPAHAGPRPERGNEDGAESKRPRRSFDGYRVLVVDDDPLIRMVVRRTLSRLGCVTDTLSNGEDVIRMLEMSPFDLVLLDIELPGMDGLAVTRVVRDPGSAVLDHDVPIVAVTMRTSEEDRRLCFEAGMNDFVGKPIRVRDLMRAIRAQMEAWSPRGD